LEGEAAAVGEGEPAPADVAADDGVDADGLVAVNGRDDPRDGGQERVAVVGEDAIAGEAEGEVHDRHGVPP
jgi:hypothetical protein